MLSTLKGISYFEYQSIRYIVFFISHLKYLVANFDRSRFQSVSRSSSKDGLGLRRSLISIATRKRNVTRWIYARNSGSRACDSSDDSACMYVLLSVCLQLRIDHRWQYRKQIVETCRNNANNSCFRASRRCQAHLKFPRRKYRLPCKPRLLWYSK